MYKRIKDITALKIQARQMYVYEGKKAIEIAEALGVSANSLSLWVNKYGWKAEKTQYLEGLLSKSNNLEDKKIIGDFKTYLKTAKPNLYKEVKTEIDNFLNLIK